MGIFTKISGGKVFDTSSVLAQSQAIAQQGQTARLLATLDVLSGSVMVADENHIIVSVNPSAHQMMKAAEMDLRQSLPNFSADNLVGNTIDVFHKNPAHQRAMLDKLQQRYETKIKVGVRSFELIATPLFSENGVRTGTAVEWKDLSAQLAAEEKEKIRTDKARATAAENARIRTALDKVTSNVMMADADNIIIYMNDAVMQMMQNAESDLRKELPNFSAAQVLGKSVDQFHKNPDHQRNMLSRLTATHKAKIAVGGRNFGLIATPVFDADKKRIGTVVEWQDNTEEMKKFDTLVNTAIDSASSGRLHERLSLDGLSGYMANFANGFNNMMDIFENVIRDAQTVMAAMASGDLTKQVTGNYEGRFEELKDSINMSVEKLIEVVSDIHVSAASVKTGAQEIALGNASLSSRTEQQAASLEETSAAMEEITATVNQNADNARQASQLAQEARSTAETGGGVVSQAVTAMAAINDSSKRITDIISVIDDIAFQTNLLALNAAVEAARAGDQGRGFAVVADEVRNLAGRSAVAAKEIKGLIQDSTTRVAEGSLLVNKSGSSLDEIMNAVKKVSDIVSEISLASNEQSSSLEEINRAIMEMDEVTQQNAALVEEAAAASESLGDQADRLEVLIGFFSLEKIGASLKKAFR